MTNSTTSKGWLCKTNFSKLKEDPIKATVRLEVARMHTTHYITLGIREYSQWFPDSRAFCHSTPAQQHYLMAECINVQVARETAVTGKIHKDQARLWTRWTTYCCWIRLLDPFLDNFTCHTQIKLLGAFAMAMREAHFSRSSHVRLAKGSISGAISHVCQTFRKHSRPNPSLDDDGKTEFLLQQELRAFKKADPAEKHQKAIPMSVISALAKQQLSELDQVIVQLTGLGMFFAFRSCEYLKVLQAEQHQTE
jgi:hypothetical protein